MGALIEVDPHVVIALPLYIIGRSGKHLFSLACRQTKATTYAHESHASGTRTNGCSDPTVCIMPSKLGDQGKGSRVDPYGGSAN